MTMREAETRTALCAKAKAMLDDRRSRDKFFPASMFHEGAWQMVLFLYVSREQDLSVYVSTACKASGVPMTSALRALDFLVSNGFVDRAEDDIDHRRFIVSLSAQGVRQIEAYLAA